MNSAHFSKIMDERNNADNITKKESQCFVCDAKIKGRYYSLATCKTQYSHSMVIKKLGELVGERYLVVISEDDVICRNCALLINTLDRLEMEINNTRDHILQFIEKKYSLEDGELRGSNDKPRPYQPPQITKSNTKDIIGYYAKENETDMETSSMSKETLKKSQLLQCHQCKYTTHVSSFMMHHFRDHYKQKKCCDKCGIYISKNNQNARHICPKINESGNKENEKDNTDIVIRTDSVETFLEKTAPSTSLLLNEPTPSLTVSNFDHIYVSKILPANDPTSSIQADEVLQPDIEILTS